MVKARKVQPSVIARFKPGHCLNCDKAVLSAKSLYCSNACSQIAALVRYARRTRTRGVFDDPDIQEAITIRLGLIIGSGGYDTKGRRIPPETRAEVYALAAGKCQKCGQKFGEDFDSQRTIQHLNGSSSDIANLQAWCMRCNKDDVLGKMVPMTDEDRAEAFMIIMRWEAKKPLRLCDDEVHWESMWRDLQAANIGAHNRKMPRPKDEPVMGAPLPARFSQAPRATQKKL